MTRTLLSSIVLLLLAAPAAHALQLSLDTEVKQVKEVIAERGLASYYAKRFDGRRTASGLVFRNSQFLAAHATLPFGTIVRVTNLYNGSFVDVQIADRGGFARKGGGLIIDLSQAAAARLNMLSRGTARVVVEVVEWSGRKSHEIADAAVKAVSE
jgi:rare lipoprotein A